MNHPTGRECNEGDCIYLATKRDAPLETAEAERDALMAAGDALADFLTICIGAVNRLTSGQGGVGYYPSQRFIHIDVGDGEVSGRRWTE